MTVTAYTSEDIHLRDIETLLPLNYCSGQFVLFSDWLNDCCCCIEADLFSVRDTSRSARRKEIILDMLRSDPVIFEPTSIWQVGFSSCSHCSVAFPMLDCGRPCRNLKKIQKNNDRKSLYFTHNEVIISHCDVDIKLCYSGTLHRMLMRICMHLLCE